MDHHPRHPKRKKAEAAGLSGRALSGIFWVGSSSWILSFLRLGTVAILARLLSPHDFGLVSACLIVVSFSEIFYLIGFGPAIVQIKGLTHDHVRTGFTFSLLLGAIAAVVVHFSSPVIAGFLKIPDATGMLAALAVVFPLRAISVVSMSLMQRDMLFKLQAGIEVISYAVGFGAIGITMAYKGFGPWALVGANIAEAVIRSILTFLRQPHSVLPQVKWKVLKELCRLGFGFSVIKLFHFFGSKGDSFVVTRWLGAELFGLYNRAFMLADTSNTLLTNVLNKVLFSAFARAQHDKKRLARGYRRGFALLALLFLPITTASIVLAPEIVHLLLGPKWTAAVLPFQILSCGILFRVGYKLSSALARGTAALYGNAWRQANFAVWVFVGAYFGLRWGLAGVAISRVLALGIHFILMTQLGLRLSGLKQRDLLRSLGPALILSMLLGAQILGITTLLRSMNLPALVIIAGNCILILINLFCLVQTKALRIIGDDGCWILQTLADRLPARFAARMPSSLIPTKSTKPETIKTALPNTSDL